MRDGPEGTQIASRLVVLDVGTDKAGRPLTSAAIESVEATTRSDGQKLPKLTRNQRTMFNILAGTATGLTTDEWYEQARQAGLGSKRRADLHDLRTSLKYRDLICENAGRWFPAAKYKRGQVGGICKIQ